MLNYSLLALVLAGAAAAEDASLIDPAFTRYVELSLVQKAISERDPALLADVALQLHEGERVLFRAHKGLPSQRVFRLAIEVAAEKRDTATLDRLERAAAAKKIEEVTRLLPAARLLAGKARRLDAGLAGDSGSAEGALLYKSVKEQIHVAASLGDKARLDRMERGLGRLTSLNSKQRAALRQEIVAARKEMKSSSDDGDDLLRKLAASARSAKKIDEAMKK
jgi:hypothetical protein